MLLAKSASLGKQRDGMSVPLLPVLDIMSDSRSQLTRLEWMWGMQYDSLELDTEANRIYCVFSSYMCLNHN